MAADLSKLDLLVIQIDGIHLADDLKMLATVVIGCERTKHPLGVIDGVTANAAVVQALLDNLLAYGLDPDANRLFIIDGAMALPKAIRQTFGRTTPVERCQVTNRGISLTDCRNRFTRQYAKPFAWHGNLTMPTKPRNCFATSRDAPNRSHLAPLVVSTRGGSRDILTVTRLGLLPELRRSLPCTNIIENMMGTIRRASRNVKRWGNARKALRWTAAGMMEATKWFRKLKAYKQLPALQAALAAHRNKNLPNAVLLTLPKPHNRKLGNPIVPKLNNDRAIPFQSTDRGEINNTVAHQFLARFGFSQQYDAYNRDNR